MRSALKFCVVGLLLVMLGESQQTDAGSQGPPRQEASPSAGSVGERPPRSERFGTGPTMSKAAELQLAHEQNLEDTSRLIKLAQELKWDLADHDRQVLALSTVKKMDEIDRLIHKIRARVGKK
jgi:hypothetical protein